MIQFKVEPEVTDTNCGFDFTSFKNGFDCPEPATQVIIEGVDFHYAHLCEEHTKLVMEELYLSEISMMPGGRPVSRPPGRPLTADKRKVVIQVLVRPVVRDYLVKAAYAERKTVSAYVNEIIEHWHEGR